MRRPGGNQHITEIQLGEKAKDSRPHLVIKSAVWPWTSPEVILSLFEENVGRKTRSSMKEFLAQTLLNLSMAISSTSQTWVTLYFPQSWIPRDQEADHRPPVMLPKGGGLEEFLPLLRSS